MEAKRPHAGAVLLAGLALGAAHTADLLFWTDPATGFATAGPAGVRYAVWLAALLLPYLPARRAAAQPAALQGQNRPLGVCMLLAGVLLAAAGALTLPAAQAAAQQPELLQGYPPLVVWLDAVLPLLAGVWLAVYGVRACTGFGLARGRLAGALAAAVVPLCMLWRLVWRFQFVPASLARLPCTLRVLSAVAALLFAVVLLKPFATPGLPCGHTLYAAGSGCFLLCTGLELVQTLLEAARGMLAWPDLLAGLGIGALGLCGLVCAWAACGPDATDADGN